MFRTIALTTLLASSALIGTRAGVPQPDSPTPGTVFKVGGQCTIGWTADTTGTWKEMYIELNTGDNFNMKHITTVAKLDGTDPKVTTFSWTCPNVTPNSNIYFYQFTSPVSTEPSWTGRFTIASASGAVTPPTNKTQPGTNDPIPWGTGMFVDPSLTTPPPYNSPKGSNLSGGSSGGGAISSSPSVAHSSYAASASAVSSRSSSLTYVTFSSSLTRSASAAASAPANGTSSAFVPRVQQVSVALAVAAVAFAVVL